MTFLFLSDSQLRFDHLFIYYLKISMHADQIIHLVHNVTLVSCFGHIYFESKMTEKNLPRTYFCY